MFVTENVIQIVQEVTKNILAQYGEDISKIILFGSQVKGTATADSDIDILALFEDKLQTVTDILFAWDVYDKYLDSYREKVHLIFEKERFYNMGCEEFYKNVPNYGVVIYDKSI